MANKFAYLFFFCCFIGSCLFAQPRPPANAPSHLVKGYMQDNALCLKRALNQLGWQYEEIADVKVISYRVRKAGEQELFGLVTLEKREKETLLSVGVGSHGVIYTTVEGESWDQSQKLMEELTRLLELCGQGQGA
jgi:hypothetical protein